MLWHPAIVAVTCLQKITPFRGRKLCKHTYCKSRLCLQKLSPFRGRKHVSCLSLSLCRNRLQKLTPIRGRKLIVIKSFGTNELPYVYKSYPRLGDGNLYFFLARLIVCGLEFTKAYPDRGTETLCSSHESAKMTKCHCLQKLTLIRGRKLISQGG